MNISKISARQCCGCGVCSTVCSGGAELYKDRDGYYKSRINGDKCVDCGRCLSACPADHTAEEIKAPSFVTFSRERQDALGSSSGGMAHVIAREYLHKGYAIIGAAWSEDYKRVEHIVVEDETGLERLRKSKYVQSYTPDAFSQITQLEKVVVFGTPCQIAGLRNLYGNRPGMILVDFDCMGPAGLGLWEKYLDYLQQINSSGIASLKMRDKKKSWMVYGTNVAFNDGSKYFKDKYHDPFCILYHLARLIQPTCLADCKYRNSSKADIRLADAWNYADGFTKEQIHDGLSLVTPITDVGKEVFKSIDGEIIAKQADRLPNKSPASDADSRIWDDIRDPNKSLESALALYNSGGAIKKLSRCVSTCLSSNETVYLLIKRLLRAVRG